MKKRIICLAAALLALLLLFSACGQGGLSIETGDLPFSSPSAPSPLPPASSGGLTARPTAPADEPTLPSPSPSGGLPPLSIPASPSLEDPPTPSNDWTPPVAPTFRTGQAFIYDVEKECFRFICGEDRIVYPASTTKLLTILYALTLFEDVGQKIAPGNELEMVKPNSSLAYIKSHHVLTVEQLVEGMLLPSGNDAAHVLAAAAGKILDPTAKDGKAAVAAFVEGMNGYAKSIGMKGSNFLNPDGYDDENHYSTLEDMAIVAKKAYECPLIRKYCNKESDDVVYASGHKMTWKNTNINLWQGTQYYSPYVNGLKTGTVNSEYYCLLSSAEIEGKVFLFGFFGEPNSDARFLDTLTAIAWVKKYAMD